MRRRLALLAVASLCVPALALAAAGDPKEAFTPADQAKAKSLLIVRADLGAGWKRTTTPDSDTDLSCPGFDPNLSDLTLTGEAESEFQHPAGVFVASMASLYRTTANAVAGWSRTVRPALARCLAHFFREGIAEEGGTATILRQGRVAFPRLAPRTAAYRITARIGAAGSAQTVPFALDFVVLGRGRADVGILAMGAGAGVPAAELRALARLAAARLQRAAG